jgi:N-acetylneuraminic acid mutarotase
VAHEGRLYLVGGKTANDVLARVIYRYTPPEDTSGESWQDIGLNLSFGVYQPVAASLGGSIIMAGGSLGAQFDKSSSVVQLDPIARTIRTLQTTASLPAARAAMGAAVINDQLYVVGGFEKGANDAGDPIDKPVDNVLRSNAL